jgi:hypothetical protein
LALRILSSGSIEIDGRVGWRVDMLSPSIPAHANTGLRKDHLYLRRGFEKPDVALENARTRVCEHLLH